MNEHIRILGLSGTNGAGKDTVGQLLAERYGYLFISVSDLLRDECRRRGLPVEREHLRAISTEWRKAQGMGVLIDRAVEVFEAAADKYTGVVMASLRNPYEADRVHELGGTVVWVDADPKTRYARIQANAVQRGRDGEDSKSFEQFLAEEQAEMQAASDKAGLHMLAVKDRSDIVINNDTIDMQVLARQVESALGLPSLK